MTDKTWAVTIYFRTPEEVTIPDVYDMLNGALEPVMPPQWVIDISDKTPEERKPDPARYGSLP